MAKSLLSVTLRAIKAAEREQVRRSKAAERAYNAELKDREREAKARERQIRQSALASKRRDAAQEKAQRDARVASQVAEVESRNAKISDIFHELEELLHATIGVDDYIDLEALRKPDSSPFDRPDLEVPLTPPTKPRAPCMPLHVEVPEPKVHSRKPPAVQRRSTEARRAYYAAMDEWDIRHKLAESAYQSKLAVHNANERNRKKELAKEKERFLSELDEHNRMLDQFISNLAYGDVNAVQEYVSMVVENSHYPDHFTVNHNFSFLPEDAELKMKVSIPPPDCFPSVKAYKYVKTTDEIRGTPISKSELKNRYCSAIYQVAIRSLHEIFEADRRSTIRTISLEVGTQASDPATGKIGYIPFVGVSAEKTAFMEFDLSNVVPLATLKHLGAAISKDPTALLAADVSGVRRS